MKLLLPLLLALSFASAPALAATTAKVPARIEMKYKVSIGPLKIGEGLDVFEHDGKTYSVVSESSTAGVAALVYRLNIRREAKGTITAAGLRPLTFSEKRNDQLKRSVTFDWAAGKVELFDGDKKQTVALPANTWDSTSFAWNFAFAQPDGKDLQIYVTDGRRVTEYKYNVVGREKLDTAMGEIETVHVKKFQDPDDKRGFDVWLALNQYFLPVRIRATEKDGTAFDSLVESITLSDKP